MEKKYSDIISELKAIDLKKLGDNENNRLQNIFDSILQIPEYFKNEQLRNYFLNKDNQKDYFQYHSRQSNYQAIIIFIKIITMFKIWQKYNNLKIKKETECDINLEEISLNIYQIEQLIEKSTSNIYFNTIINRLKDISK
jgi:hypothetical protein